MTRMSRLLLVTITFVLCTVGASANHGTGTGQSFLFLQPGFTQEIFGVSQHFMGGVAFAPDDDPWVNDCQFSGSHLHRYDRQGVAPEVNGTKLHPESIADSDAGCGMTNHPNGSIYTNQGGGVVRLDASTGAHMAGPFGPGGNALGIAVDPVTDDLVYVGSDGTIYFVDPAFSSSGTFSVVTTGNFLDGIGFDPDGDYLFIANRSPSFRLTIVDRSGALVQHVLMANEPDGISFHASAPKFVVTNNTDGTMTRFDFPGDDFTQVPVQSVFASGGFRGDLSQVGADGCIYLTQAGTRYDNLVVSSENSLVRICGGFAPPPGVEICGDGIDNDGDGEIDEGCNTPPICDAEPTVSSIWPPNHKMVDVGITGVTDPDGDPVTVTITAIMQDEPTNTAGDGNTACDAEGVGGPAARVRAERSGSKKVPGNGRFYHIFFTADDGEGGSCEGSVVVAVPHDQSHTPVDEGPLYNSCAP